MQPLKIFLICSVRAASKEIEEAQCQYVEYLENLGHQVHYPPRDTNQMTSSIEICQQNYEAIKNADIVHVFYNPDSQGTHFDLGMAFALQKTIIRAGKYFVEPGKSFARLILEWQNKNAK